MPHVERGHGEIVRGDPDRPGANGRKTDGMTGIMTVEPFEISPQRLPWLDAEIAERVATIIRDAERRLAGMTVAQDGRRGFGTVYAKGRMRTVGGTLTWWVWRSPNAEHCPLWLDAERFADDPMGAVATDCSLPAWPSRRLPTRSSTRRTSSSSRVPSKLWLQDRREQLAYTRATNTATCWLSI